MSKNIPVLDLQPEIELLWDELMPAIQDVLRSGHFIMGPNVKEFEKEVAAYLEVKHAIAVNSGTDALVIGLRAAGIGHGDEVITTPFTFFATAEAISQVGATPIFVDIEEHTYNIDPACIEKAITPRTKAILPVHLYGQSADMSAILDIAHKHGLKVVEDVAQAFGADYEGKKTGTIADVGCFSFFPSKNLGAYGDGGLIATNDDQIAEQARMLRMHGAKKKYHNEILGYNSRLDELQAAILRVKLPHIDKWNEGRREVARRYNEALSQTKGLIVPMASAYGKHVYHQYTVRVLDGKREWLQQKLQEEGIQTMIYYPIPVHQLPLYKEQVVYLPVSERLSQEVISLPIWPQMDEETQNRVIRTIQQLMN